MKRAIIIILILFSAVYAMAQNEEGLWATTVSIEPERDEVLPGEVIEISLSSFLDFEGNLPEKGFKIIVVAIKGKILNGENSHLPGGKSFLISEPIILKYRAPDFGNKDNIVVHSDHTLPVEIYGKTVDDGELLITEKIGEREITIVRGDFARLKLYDYYHSQQKNSSSTTEINITLGVRFQSMGGAGMMIPHQVLWATVMECSGTCKSTNGGEYTLISATPKNPHSAIMLYKGLMSGQIEAVVFPQFELKLSWAGSGGITPPDYITMSPVSEWDKKAEKAKMKAKSKDLKASMKKGNINLQKIMGLQKDIKSAITHPDYKVKTTFTKIYVAGEGELEKSAKDWQLKKRFTWEFQLKKHD